MQSASKSIHKEQVSVISNRSTFHQALRYGIYAKNLEHVLPCLDVTRVQTINVVELLRHDNFELFLNFLYRFAVFPALLLGESKEFTYGRCICFVVKFGVL